jgi:hypothetical protein
MSARDPLGALVDRLHELGARHRAEGAGFLLSSESERAWLTASLPQFRLERFFDEAEAVPGARVLTALGGFASLVGPFYKGQERPLHWLLVEPLIPADVRPLRPGVVAAMALAAPSVRYEPAAPARDAYCVRGAVNGWGDLGIAVADGELRAAVVERDPPALPAWLAHADESGEAQAALAAFVRNGRQNQLHAFLACVARTDPRRGVLPMAAAALLRPDLSFAVAVCAGAAADALPVCADVLYALLRAGRLDHFLRSLACAVRRTVARPEWEPSWEMRALSNCFLAAARQWAAAVPPEDGVEAMLARVCADIADGGGPCVPPLARYIARAALVVAAYEDPTGVAALAMFMELIAIPVARKVPAYAMDGQWLKRRLVSAAPSAVADAIVRAIKSLLTEEVRVEIPEEEVDMANTYRWMFENADTVVRLVLYLNDRPPCEVPAAEGFLFALEKAALAKPKSG